MNEVPLPSPDEKTNQLVVDPVVHLSVVIIAIVMSWSGEGGGGSKNEKLKKKRILEIPNLARKLAWVYFSKLCFCKCALLKYLLSFA